MLEKRIKKDPAHKTNAERYKYDVDTNKAKGEVIDFVSLNATPIDKTKHNKSDTQKPRKTNLQIISQYLTLDPVVKKSANATIEQTKLSDDLELVTLVDNDVQMGEKYAEILSNEIPQLKFYNLDKFEFATQKDSENNSLVFIPVTMVTKKKRFRRSRKNKNKKTAHEIDNSMKTKFLVTNDGLQTTDKIPQTKKIKGFRSSSSLSRQHTSNSLQHLLKKTTPAYNLSNTKESGNLYSLGKKQLYIQILQSYNTNRGRKQLKKRKRRFRKRKNSNRKSENHLSSYHSLHG
jgi:hypothetical protein